MDKNEKIKMIGFTPNQKEHEQINYIAEIYHLTNAGVIKNLLYNAVTLKYFYERAKKYAANRVADEIDMDEMIGKDMFIL